MALDMHLKLDGGSVKFSGDSKHKGHPNEIPILAWSWGMSQSGSFTTGGSGGGAGKANVQDISFTKYLDKSSSQFINALVTGAHIETVDLAMSKAGGDQKDFLKITLTHAMVTSYSTGGSGGEDMITENISITFGKFKFEHFGQAADGSVASTGEITWDMEESAKV